MLPALHNLLEPRGLIDHFLAHPPAGFAATALPSGMPAFEAPFDLLTTADEALRRRITRLPLHRWWGRWLQPRTAFLGSTVSEYALFPAGVDAKVLLREWMDARARGHAFLIVKDIPQASPLLDRASNAASHAMATACEARDFVLLEGQALAWAPIDFDSADEYLARLSAGRRKDIRRKLRVREGIAIAELPTGDPRLADPALREAMYALYLQVYAQSDIHFDLLTRAFFDAVLQDAALGGVVFTYRVDDRLIGWNLCFIVGETLVDKYVGFDYPAARDWNLYFVSWMHNLEYARRRGLACYIAGWTDPEIKASLGARFTFTRHAVRPRSRVLRAALRRLAPHFESDRAWAERRSAGGST